MSSSIGVSSNTYDLKIEEIEEINRSFQQFDLNNNGYITRDELKECLKTADVVAVDAAVDCVLKEMDWNHDGKISHGEYLKFMATIYRNEHQDLKRHLGNANDNVGSSTAGL